MKFHGLKKAAAHWSSFWGLLAVYFVTLVLEPDIAATIAVPVVAALVAQGGISQQMNVQADKNKAEHYVPEMDKAGKE
jgi:uncharacterized membrane protein